MQDTALDWLISVDDHVLEPPDLWQKTSAGPVSRCGSAD
jgi:hypothetical protein